MTTLESVTYWFVSRVHVHVCFFCAFRQEPLIHTLVKCGSSLKQSPDYDTIKDRRSVILLGDQPGDCRMGEGIDAER